MWKKVMEYSLNWRKPTNSGIIYLKLEDGSIRSVRPDSLQEVAMYGDILRNEKPIFFHTDSQDLTTGWEPTGEEEAPNH